MKTVETQQEHPTFTSDHLYLVAYLICSGYHPFGSERTGSRIAFQFAKTPALLAAVAGFMSGAVIPARQFSFEILKLKRTVHGQ
jgi:hypothetical protein